MLNLLAAIRFPEIDPVIIRLGPVAVHWYGVAYLLAFAVGYLWLQRMSRRGMLRMPPALVPDLATWLVAGVIVGGRLGYWMFYHRPVPGAADAWYEPIAIWRGGMSFHGGLAGVFLAMLIWTRVRKLGMWNLADCAALVTPVGLFFGRIANFINAELFGRPTEVPWGVIFPVGKIEPGRVTQYEAFARHPSQLYEAVLEGPLLLAVLWAAWRWGKMRDGQIGALFVIAYGVVRFLVEFTRQPDPQLGYIAFGWLTMGQLLSVLIVACGAALWWWRRRASDLPAARPVADEAPRRNAGK